MKLSKNSNYELSSYIYKVISQLVCEIISFENVIRSFRSRNEHRVMCLYLHILGFRRLLYLCGQLNAKI